MKNLHSKLTLTERQLIAGWKNKGISNKQIGKRLSRHPTTIANEVKRNSFKPKIYEPLHAQTKAEARKQKAWKAKQPLKNKDVYAYVLEKLRWGWSPEQIAGRLKHDHPDDKYWQIHHETIYRYIYHAGNKEKRLWEYLRRKQKRRKLKQGRKAQRVHIPDRVSIHNRPEAIDNRKQIGHWEGDSIVGKTHQNGLHTEYERVASFTRMEKLNRINADETVKAFNEIFGPLPSRLKKSTTLDNGSEMAQHIKLRNKGTFAVDGNKPLHNIFDEYNLAKTVYFTLKEKNLVDTEVVIDRADRRLLDNSFKNFDKYLLSKVNTKTVSRVKFVTHANSEYVFLMQMSDLICGAVKDSLNSDNNGLKSVINRQLLRKIW